MTEDSGPISPDEGDLMDADPLGADKEGGSDDEFHDYECERSYKLELVQLGEKVSKPCPRFSCCVANWNGGFYVWGGRQSREHFKTVENSMWRFDFKEKTWSRIEGKSAGGGHNDEYQESRTGATGVVHDDALWVFGGYHSKYTNTMIKFDFKTSTWSRVQTTGHEPPRRWHYSIVKYKNCLWMFGGTMDRTHYNDFHKFDFATESWSVVTSINAEMASNIEFPRNHKFLESPRARRRHTAVVWEDAMWIIGGREEGNLPTDLIRFDFASMCWSKLAEGLSNDSGCAIPKCADHSTWIDDKNSRMIIFGAIKDTNITTYCFKTNTMIPVSSRSFVRNGLHRVTSHHGNCVYHEGKLYIFGGQLKDKSLSNELYSFDLSPRPKFKSNLAHLLDNEALSDVTFVVGEEEIPAHRVILFAQCQYFRALFAGNFQEAQKQDLRIEIKNCSKKVFMAVLRFLYTDELWAPHTVAQCLEMLTVVDLYGIKVLRDHCVCMLESRVKDDNALELLQAAMKFGLTSLQGQCCQHIVSNFQKYYKDLVNLPNRELVEMVLSKVADDVDPLKPTGSTGLRPEQPGNIFQPGGRGGNQAPGQNRGMAPAEW